VRHWTGWSRGIYCRLECRRCWLGHELFSSGFFFPHSLQTKPWMVPQLGHNHFLPNSFRFFFIHVSSYHPALYGLITNLQNQILTYEKKNTVYQQQWWESFWIILLFSSCIVFMCNQNYWVCGLFPSSSLLGTRKHDISETGSVILSVIHRQNPLESTYSCASLVIASPFCFDG
jgi:hypothetical protein